MQASRWFIEGIHTALLCHVNRKFEALAFTSRKDGQGLAKAEVAQPNVIKYSDDFRCGKNTGLTLGIGAKEAWLDAMCFSFIRAMSCGYVGLHRQTACLPGDLAKDTPGQS